jgi:hypothetical protein
LANITALGGNIDDITKKLNTLVPSLSNIGSASKDLSTSLGITVSTSTSFSGALDAVTAAQTKANQALTQAKGALDAASAGLQDGSVSQQVYNRALADYETALDKVTAKGKNFSDTVAGIAQAMQLAQEKAQSSISVYNTVNTAFDNGTTSLGNLSEAYKKAQSAATAAGVAFADASGIMAQQGAANAQAAANLQAYDTVITKYLAQLASGNLTAAQTVQVTQDIATTYGLAQKAADATGTSYYNVQAATIAANNAAQKQQSVLEDAAATWSDYASITNKNVTQQEAMATAFSAVQKDAASLGLSVTQVGNALVFTTTNSATATAAQLAFAKQLTDTFANGTDLVTVNGKLVATLQSIQDQSNNAGGAIKTMGTVTAQMVQTVGGAVQVITEVGKVANDTGSAFNGATIALQQHANALNVVISAAQGAASAMANVTIATKNLQIGANNTVQQLQNAVDTFNNLNSTTATTAQQQIALQNAFQAVQSAAQASGLQVQFVGNQLVFTTNAATKSIPAFQNLASALNDDATAAQGATNQLQQVGQAASQTGQDLSALTGIAKEVSAALDSIGNGGQGGGGSVSALPGSSISSGEPSATGAPFGSQTGIIPIPRDPNPGTDYWNGLAGAWEPIPPGYTSINKTTTGAAGAVASAPQAPTNNPSPFPTTGAAGGITAFSDAVGAATAAVTAVSDAATAVASPLGDFGAAIPAATTAVTQMTTGMLSTSHTASEYETAQENASGATDAYATATANLVNAQNAFTNGMQQGLTGSDLGNLWQAMEDASQTLEDMTGQSQVAGSTFKQLATSLSTSVTAQDLYGADLAGATTLGQENATAQAALVNAQNAYTNALTSGTATQDQLNQLLQAAGEASKQVQNTTGEAPVSNDNTGPGVTIPAAPTSPPAGGDPTGKWQWSGTAWVWVAGLNPMSAQVQGVPANIANQAIGPSGPTQLSPGGYTDPYTTSGAQQIAANNNPITINMSFGTVVGTNAAQQLTNIVAPGIVAQLRQAGVKI